MLTNIQAKVAGSMLVLACTTLLIGTNCVLTPPELDEGSTDPISSSVLGVVVTAGGATVKVDILAGGVSIVGAPLGGFAVLVPVNQDYDKTITAVAPHRARDIHSLLWSDGNPRGVRVYMKVVTTDALGEGQHTVSFYFSAWNDVGNVVNMYDSNDTPAALPDGAGGSLNLQNLIGNIVVRVGNVRLQDHLGVPFNQVTEIVADLTGPAVAPYNMGRPYILYMRESPLGRFYNLSGVEASIADPNSACATCFSAQVPGDFFFHNVALYGFDLDGGPFGGLGGIGDADGNANGEFEYTLLNASFTGAAQREVVLDPWNGGVATPVPAANLTPGNNTVHELAVACTFLNR